MTASQLYWFVFNSYFCFAFSLIFKIYYLLFFINGVASLACSNFSNSQHCFIFWLTIFFLEILHDNFQYSLFKSGRHSKNYCSYLQNHQQNFKKLYFQYYFECCQTNISCFIILWIFNSSNCLASASHFKFEESTSWHYWPESAKS